MKKEMTKGKKRLIKVAAVLIAALLIAGSVGLYIALRTEKIEPMETVKLSSISEVDASDIVLAAHRGLSATEPENSLPAVRAACAAGYDAVEFDIHCTKDGVWVVMHDENLRRTTDGSGKIGKYTYAQLQEFNIDNGANAEKYTGLKIPTLSEVLAEMSEYYPDTRPMIEIKDTNADELGSLPDIIAGYNAAGRKAVIISFSSDVLLAMKERCPQNTYWLLASDLDDNTLEFCRTNEDFWVAFNGNKEENNAQRIAAFSDAKIPLAAWTIDSGEKLKELYDAGIRYFTTNCILPLEKEAE